MPRFERRRQKGEWLRGFAAVLNSLQMFEEALAEAV